MSNKKAKTYRRIAQKKMDDSARSIIYKYIENVCNEPLKVRVAYYWKILWKKNPHTGKKVV